MECFKGKAAKQKNRQIRDELDTWRISLREIIRWRYLFTSCPSDVYLPGLRLVLKSIGLQWVVVGWLCLFRRFFYLYLLISIFALQLFIGPLFCFLMASHCFRLVPMFAALGLGLDQESVTSNVLPSLQYEFFSTSFFEVGYFSFHIIGRPAATLPSWATTEPKDATIASIYVNILLLLYSSFYFVGWDCKVTRKICFNKNAMKKYAGNFSDFVADLPFVEAKLKLKSSRQLLFRLKLFVSLPSSGGFMTF